jgi:hypothetical protein
MTGPKLQASRRGAAGLAAEIAGSEDAPLEVLLRMMEDSETGSDDRIDIARICLPFVHPRIAQLRPSEIEPEDAPIDICDPNHVQELIRTLAFALNSSANAGRKVPGHIWNLIRHIPRGPDDLKAPASSKASDVPER